MGAIDLTTANQMIENYTVTRRMLINKTYGINDTRAIWFSMDTLNEFISGLPPDATGVRVYLAAYDVQDPTYPNQTTILLIGTQLDANGNNVDAISQKLTTVDVGDGPFNHGDLCPPGVGCN